MADNNTFDLRRRELVLAAMSLLAGCGGGVDSGGTGTGAAATLAVGPITGLGSIIVNGVRYDDSTASVVDDAGQAAVRGDLKLGMQTEILASAVAVTAGVSTATASAIRVRSEIVGPLESADSANARLRVFGQDVTVLPTTVFDTAIAAGMVALVPGDVLEVYAILDVAAGRYVASRIERRSGVDSYKLRGTVGSLSLGARTLTLGGLTVDWSAVAPSDPATSLAVGSFVRFTLRTAPTVGIWRAKTLQVGVPVPADREHAEIEGRITSFTSIARFAVNGIEVETSSGTTFPNGSAGLAVGVRAEVEGRIAGGRLLASEVKLEGEDDDDDAEAFELHGSIDTVDAGAKTFVVRGTLVVWSASTEFDSSGPSDIVPGRQVEVKGRLSSDGTRVEATKVHVER